MMVAYVDEQYVVSVDGHVIGQFDRYDDALSVYFEIVPSALAF